MRRCIFPFTLMLLLCGCSTSPAEPVTETLPSETVPSTEAETATASGAETGLTFSVHSRSIDFYQNGVFLQTLTSETDLGEKDIVLTDYDSDGFADVFLPERPRSFRGHYYHYDAAAGRLVLWDVLNAEESGTGWYMEKNADGTLTMTAHSIYGSTCTTYRWEQDVLIPEALLEHYWNEKGTVEDTYIFSDAQEKILVERAISDDDGNPVRSIGYPLYFRITEDAVLVLKNAEIVQTLALGSFWESYAALGEFFRQQQQSPTMPMEGAYLREPESYLGTADYDFDGHDDLYIPDTLQGACTGTYYRYDPDACAYVAWDALNAIGHALYTEADDHTRHGFAEDGTERIFCSSAWKDGGLVRIPEE